MRTVALVTVVACAIASMIAVVLLRGAGSHLAAATSTPAASASASASASPSQVPHDNDRDSTHLGPLKVGVVANSLLQFEEAAGVYPSIDVKYVQWGSPFPSAEVLEDHGLGVTTMIVLEPNNVSLAGLVNGNDNAYLTSWARADRKLGLPVILSFAPEANGSWYPWGARHITPDLYRETWRHVHDELTATGARHVTWLWQVCSAWPTSEPLSLLWPGNSYVDEVGIDGQLNEPAASFTSTFSQTVAQVQAITEKPVMISEVAIGRNPQRPAQITGLFSGARRDGLYALILFDVHSKWQINSDPAALDAFRKAAKEVQ
jgi:hypothetical protein